MAKVLLIDDDPSYRDLLEFILSEVGHEVRTVPSAEAAIEVSETFLPDVLVADWMLRNDMNGLDASRILSEANPDLQTIVISGYPSAELEEQIDRQPSTQFLTKPFRPEELLQALDRAAGAADSSEV
jgi:CheY-like chemotaxis protein